MFIRVCWCLLVLFLTYISYISSYLLSLFSFLPIGILLLQLTGHRDLVTNIEMRSLSCTKAPRKEGEKEGEPEVKEVSLTQSGETATDMLVSVSDDHTARVFYYCGSNLLM